MNRYIIHKYIYNDSNRTESQYKRMEHINKMVLIRTYNWESMVGTVAPEKAKNATSRIRQYLQTIIDRERRTINDGKTW